jgi:hypothetical protein
MVTLQTARRAAALLLALTAGATHLSAQESANFKLDRLTPAGGAARLSSLTFEASVTVAQVPPAGAASLCNAGAVNSFGFWSVIGDLPVPLLLTAKRNKMMPELIRLLWSGTDPEYALYRSEDPSDIFSLPNLVLETTLCEASESIPTAPGDILFYNVIPKPPSGP